MSHIRSRCALDKKVEKKNEKAVSSCHITNCTIGPSPPSVDSNSLLSRENVYDFHSEHTRRVRLYSLITDGRGHIEICASYSYLSDLVFSLLEA
jgi:hypothetical protein